MSQKRYSVIVPAVGPAMLWIWADSKEEAVKMIAKGKYDWEDWAEPDLRAVERISIDDLEEDDD